MSWTRKLFVQGGSRNTEADTSFPTIYTTNWNTNTTSNTDVATTRLTSTVWSFGGGGGAESRNTTTTFNTNRTTTGTVSRNTTTNWNTDGTWSTSWLASRNTSTDVSYNTHYSTIWVASSQSRNTTFSTNTRQLTFIRNTTQIATTTWLTNRSTQTNWTTNIPQYSQSCNNTTVTTHYTVPYNECRNTSVTVSGAVAGYSYGCEHYNTAGTYLYSDGLPANCTCPTFTGPHTEYESYAVMGFIQPYGGECAEDDRGLGSCVLYNQTYKARVCYGCTTSCNTTYTSTSSTCWVAGTNPASHSTTWSSCVDVFVGYQSQAMSRNTTTSWNTSRNTPIEGYWYDYTSWATNTTDTTSWDVYSSRNTFRGTVDTLYSTTSWYDPSNVRNTTGTVNTNRSTSTSWSGDVNTVWSTNDTTSTSWVGEGGSDSRNTSTDWNTSDTTSWTTQ